MKSRSDSHGGCLLCGFPSRASAQPSVRMMSTSAHCRGLTAWHYQRSAQQSFVGRPTCAEWTWGPLHSPHRDNIRTIPPPASSKTQVLRIARRAVAGCRMFAWRRWPTIQTAADAAGHGHGGGGGLGPGRPFWDENPDAPPAQLSRRLRAVLNENYKTETAALRCCRASEQQPPAVDIGGPPQPRIARRHPLINCCRSPPTRTSATENIRRCSTKQTRKPVFLQHRPAGMPCGLCVEEHTVAPTHEGPGGQRHPPKL